MLKLILCLVLIYVAAATVGYAEIISEETTDANEKYEVFTVATERTDGYERYMRSARAYDIKVTTLGLDQEWLGGNMEGQGGGFKINLLREAVEPLKNNETTYILFSDSYDVVFTAPMSDIIKKFKETGAKVVFSAEKFCWPDRSLAKDYPNVADKASRYLNSGAFIGYAPQIYALLKTPIKDTDDDQLYYTNQFLDKETRKTLHMQLDIESKIFQNLNGAKDDVKLNVDLDSNEGVLENIIFKTQPSLIHGNGPSKVELNAYANYLAKIFNHECLLCQENRIELDENNLPTITLALIIAQAVPFFETFLEKIENLNYPKKSINLFIYSNQIFHEEMVESFLKRLEDQYLSTKIVLSTDEIKEKQGRDLALQQAKLKKSDYFFSVDSDVHIDDPELLRELLIVNKQFVAPVVAKHNELWSNFWGDLSSAGFYARSHDYVDIVKGDIIGMWNVPYVSSIYLIKSTAFKYVKYDHQYFDPDMAMCDSLRNAGVFMNVINKRVFGHIINGEEFNITVARPDFYTLSTNRFDWIKKYVHPNYAKQLEANATIQQPCPDVFWFQVVTDAFCDDLLFIVESYGKWSDGSNEDTRIQGGYEAVPTRDIHMRQVGLHEMWLQFLNLIVRPLQEKVFLGYKSTPQSTMNFLVRYRPDEQPSLRPHNDHSTYTINIALNRVGIDYEGGGCHFLRYNCSVINTKKGWMLMHPGRLTHYHEGLTVSSGVRYIMISFVDP